MPAQVPHRWSPRRPVARSGRRPAFAVLAVVVVLGLVALVGCDPADQYPRRVPPAVDARHPFQFFTLAGTVTAGSGSAPKPIALTFDDGPSAYSESIVSILHTDHVPATFFVIGDQVKGRSQVIHDELEWGNRVGAHSWSHVDLTKLSAADLAREIDWSRDVLTPLLGSDRARCLRPPGGATDATVRTAIATAGLGETLWSVDPDDWKRPPTATIVTRVVSAARPGSIVLLHDGGGDRSHTVAALPTIIEELRERGYTFVSVC